jgi:hypothetical protein
MLLYWIIFKKKLIYWFVKLQYTIYGYAVETTSINLDTKLAHELQRDTLISNFIL